MIRIQHSIRHHYRLDCVLTGLLLRRVTVLVCLLISNTDALAAAQAIDDFVSVLEVLFCNHEVVTTSTRMRIISWGIGLYGFVVLEFVERYFPRSELRRCDMRDRTLC